MWTGGKSCTPIGPARAPLRMSQTTIDDWNWKAWPRYLGGLWGWLWAVPNSKSTCWGATIIQRLPPLQPSWHSSWATCQERILPFSPSLPALHHPGHPQLIHFAWTCTAISDERPFPKTLLCWQSVLSGELDTPSCSMWAIGLWTLRKFIENTVEWNRGVSLPFLNCQCM